MDGADFTRGIFDCCDDVNVCLISWFLPCITAGKNAQYVDENCLLYGFGAITCLGPITRALIRNKIRAKHNIKGGLANDVICHFCCGVCALAQEAQEIKVHGGPGPLSMARE